MVDRTHVIIPCSRARKGSNAASAGSSARGRARIGSGLAGLLGVAASLACTAAMVLPVLGVVGTAGAAAQGAGGGADPILIVSIVLITVSLAVRRALAAVPALAFGALLYWGMYGQPSDLVMYLTLALTYAGWLGTYLWTRRRPARQPTAQHTSTA